MAESVSFFFFFSSKGILCGANWRNISLGNTITLTSPNFPLYYPPDVQCIWHLKSINGLSFAIKFLNFDTEPETDVLTLGKGEDIIADSTMISFSSLIPAQVVAVLETSAMWLTFDSNIVGTKSGFELQIERIPNSGECFV